ncbi:MAG: hypothetical protein ACLGGX_11150 [Bdellovibrionia bacterium]
MKQLKITTVVISLILSQLSLAQTSNSEISPKNSPPPLSGLDYPELQVAPRASERLQALSQWEEKSSLLTQWTMLTSGVATFASAMQMQSKYRTDNLNTQEKKDADLIAKTGQAVGLTWIGIASYLMTQKPATRAWQNISKTPAKDKRQDLTRERLSEEVLEQRALMQDRLETLSIGSNFIVSAAMLGQMHDDHKPIAVVSLLASALPWLSESEYIRTYNKHRESKRKIYAPLVSLDAFSQKDPQLVFSWNF